MKVNLDISSDYYQFYIHDKDHSDTSVHLWDEQEVKQMISISNYSVGIGTYRSDIIPVEIEIKKEFSINEYKNYDRINKCDLNIESGNFIVRGVTDYLPSSKVFSINKGIYALNVLYFGKSTISDDELEGEDHYKLIISEKG